MIKLAKIWLFIWTKKVNKFSIGGPNRASAQNGLDIVGGLWAAFIARASERF